MQDETDYFRTCYSDGGCASVPVVVYWHARGAALTQHVNLTNMAACALLVEAAVPAAST